MKEKPKTSIGSRITLYSIIIATVAFLSIGVLITLGSFVAHQRAHIVRNDRILAFFSEKVVLQVDNAREALVTLSEVLPVVGEDNELRDSVLYSFSSRLSKFRRLYLIDTSLQLLATTDSSYPLPPITKGIVANVLAGPRIFSDLGSFRTDRPVITIGTPVRRKGENDYALFGEVALDPIWENLEASLRDDEKLSLLSSNGTIVFSQNKDRVITDFAERYRSGAIGSDNHYEQNKTIVQFRAIDELSWMIVFVQPLEAHRKPVRHILFYTCGMLGIIFIILVFVSRRLTKHICLPIQQFVERINCVSTGDFSHRMGIDTAFTELDNLSSSFNNMTRRMEEYTTALISSQKQLRALVQEKEILLRELHHRVKNNLQIISSILELKADSMEEETVSRVFEDSQKRIESMSLVHEQLSTSKDLSNIELAMYITSLIENIIQYYELNGRGMQVYCDIDPVIFPIDKAIPLGLIINELVSNSITHAFPDGLGGTITLTIKKTDRHRIQLFFKDDGVGLDTPIDTSCVATLGFTLIHSLTRQLKGSVTINGKQGFECRLEFPIPQLSSFQHELP